MTFKPLMPREVWEKVLLRDLEPRAVCATAPIFNGWGELQSKKDCKAGFSYSDQATRASAPRIGAMIRSKEKGATR